eukprot:gnl/MRDRNA2_/MRDRNA2_144318_c0_seq1.p1 gnl/MRDRNA2_/MRDRNA2_144318_c0~~gnl/MRDRNA2_/MRDRNA2_144318_c0_seq1.p1  ORF type:complete len:238 (+),score=36.88 gnl/MRDRNA2_/MRDRNA2_144318_c0_seq1:1-714(+)
MYIVLRGKLSYLLDQSKVQDDAWKLSRKIIARRTVTKLQSQASAHDRDFQQKPKVQSASRSLSSSESTLGKSLSGGDLRENEEEVEEGDHVSEAVLWTIFSHRGNLVANTSCELLVLSATDFQSLTTSFGRIAPAASMYGEAFVNHLNEQDVVSDLGFSEDDLNSLVSQAFKTNPDCDDSISIKGSRELMGKIWSGRKPKKQSIVNGVRASILSAKGNARRSTVIKQIQKTTSGSHQ